MQRVDPFIPVSPRRTLPAQPRAVRTTVPPQPVKQPPGGVDGFISPRAVSLPPQSVAVPPAAPVAQQRQSVKPARPPAKAKHHRMHMRSALRTTGLVAAVLVAGIVAQTLFAGEILIAAYAVYALVRHVASRTTFILTLLSLATIVVLRVVGKDTLLASNFAVYSLLLAFVGVITLAREVRQSKA